MLAADIVEFFLYLQFCILGSRPDRHAIIITVYGLRNGGGVDGVAVGFPFCASLPSVRRKDGRLK